MKISIQDSVQMHRDFYETFPRDLVEDLAEEDPQLTQTSESLDTLLTQTRQGLKEIQDSKKAVQWKFPLPQPHCPLVPESFQQKYSVQFPRPHEPAYLRTTLVVPGWNVILNEGQNIAFMVDGPVGPRQKIKNGLIKLAKIELEKINLIVKKNPLNGKVENIKTFGLSAVVWQEETRDIYEMMKTSTNNETDTILFNIAGVKTITKADKVAKHAHIFFHIFFLFIQTFF